MAVTGFRPKIDVYEQGLVATVGGPTLVQRRLVRTRSVEWMRQCAKVGPPGHEGEEFAFFLGDGNVGLRLVGSFYQA